MSWFLAATLPRTSGRVEMQGLSSAIEVWRDRWGVPTIRAGSATDAMAALGWLHASDRMWQMEMRRRAAAGRLSELFGPAAVETDFSLRLHDLADLARRDLATLSGPERDELAAYTRGVNAWIASRRYALPPEFLLLRTRPEPWRMEDSLAFVRMMLLSLTVAHHRELRRFDWFARLGERRAADLMAIEPGAPAAAVRPPEVEAYFLPGLDSGAGRGGEASGVPPGEADAPEAAVPAGSNAWALSAALARGPAPLLANDPHLGVEQPSVWYEASIITPDLHVRGLTLAGAPQVVIGRNRHLAWGITVHAADDEDLFLERTDGADPPRVLESDGTSDEPRWVPVTTRAETVRVRGGPPVTREFHHTSRGVLLPPGKAKRPAMSLRTAMIEGPAPMGMFRKIGRARDAGEMLAALPGFCGPALNFSYADDAGAFGYQTAGLIPRRRAGDGRLPVPAWTGRYGWDGWVPFGEMPSSHDPPSGIAVTANNDLRSPSRRDVYSGDWAPDARAARIAARLVRDAPWTAGALRDLQTDVVSPLGLSLVGAARRILAGAPAPLSDDASHALEALRGWNGRMSREGPSRLVAELTRELVERVAGDEARAAGTSRVVGFHGIVRILEGAPRADWFDDVSSPQRETAAVIVEAALAAAYRRVVSEHGEDPRAWSWGAVHTVSFPHPLGRPTGLSRWLDLGPVPLPGDGETVNVAVYSLSAPFRVLHIPSARLIFDLADPDRSLAVIPTGQSGHPLSRHYGDQLELWSSGGYRPAPFTEAAAREAAVKTLRIDPAGAEPPRGGTP